MRAPHALDGRLLPGSVCGLGGCGQDTPLMGVCCPDRCAGSVNAGTTRPCWASAARIALLARWMRAGRALVGRLLPGSLCWLDGCGHDTPLMGVCCSDRRAGSI